MGEYGLRDKVTGKFLTWSAPWRLVFDTAEEAQDYLNHLDGAIGLEVAVHPPPEPYQPDPSWVWVQQND